MKTHTAYIYFVTFSILLFVSLSSCGGDAVTSTYGIIPCPNQIESVRGTFHIKDGMTVTVPQDSLVRQAYNFLEKALANTPVRLKIAEEVSPIRLIVDDSIADEAYRLDVNSDRIELTANRNGAGFFYGIQTLIQLMPADIFKEKGYQEQTIPVQAVRIEDSPRFPYRGSMLDVARYFMPKDFVLKYIDLLAMYKFNRFHFHLTNDQGWRIEIKKYPRLTEIGSVRSRSMIGHSDYYLPWRFDSVEHKGFYTQEEIREIVRYAQERFITVIPEIEMPGHSSAALASYPELSCGLEESYKVQDRWDIFDQVFCPKETTIEFLENVLTEVMELFPGNYIHIGGDECPKKSWKRCPHCQALMKKEGLKTEEELQSWFIHRIEKFVNSKGRNIIGWDEILEGGLAPNATVMSWRGEKGGIAAAKSGHSVIMAPGKYCYYNYYQEDPEFAPLAIGNFLPLDSAYNYNPVPTVLSPQESRFIIGGQANLWAEYISNEQTMEYMAFPRLLAMAEVLWTQPERKDFKEFSRALVPNFQRLDDLHVNACRNFFEVNFNSRWDDEKQVYKVIPFTFYPDAEIRYSIGGGQLQIYKEPIYIRKNETIQAVAYWDGKPLGKQTQKSFYVNAATGHSYTCQPKEGWEHVNFGKGLTDGIRGFSGHMRNWVSFYEDTVQVTIDLKQVTPVKAVSFGTLFRPINAIWPARAGKVFVSADGKDYKLIGEQSFDYDWSVTEATRFQRVIECNGEQGRYVRLELLSGGICPKGYYQEGEQSELALDEIEINE